MAPLLAVSCAGSDEPQRPLLDRVSPALAAVEAELGGPQRYFEVNATPSVVNVFVAVDGATAAVAYAFSDGDLSGPAAPRPAQGATFAATAVAFDPATVLDGVTTDLPESDVVSFSVVGGPGGAVQYGADVASREGGTLAVTIAADGRVVAVDPG